MNNSSEITEIIKELRRLTGAPILDCKKVFLECNGDIEKASSILKEKGFAIARKKEGRATTQGTVASYIHHDGNTGVLVELNCETDFVARNEIFKNLAREIAMQIAACSPLYISREDIPPQVLEEVPEDKREEYCCANCLLDQPFIRDGNLRVKDIIVQAIGKLGENIVVRRFVRYRVGE